MARSLPAASPKGIRWTFLARRVHLFLSIFFTPLLILFIVTGWWQTAVSSDDRDNGTGAFHDLMSKLSNVHTDHSYPGFHIGHGHAAPGLLKGLVIAMAVALLGSILLGLFLAWQSLRRKWIVLLCLILGIVVPVAAIYFAA